MIIKESEIVKLLKFNILASDFATIPSKTKVSASSLSKLKVDLDFRILEEPGSSSEIKILIEVHCNKNKKQLKGYAFSVIAQALFNFPEFEKISEKRKNKTILFTAIPMAIAMLRSFLYNMSSSYPYGNYLLPAIDLEDLYKKKFVEKE